MEERRCVERVAFARGCSSAPPAPEDGAWPDGWLVEPPNHRIPVEVVSAFERKAGEDPRRGAGWKRAHAQAERDAQKIEQQTGEPVAFGAHYDEPFVVPLDGTHMIPPRLTPFDPVPWIETAVRQKIEKRYSGASEAILVVDFAQPFNLDPSQLVALGRALVDTCPFREVWIVNQYGDPAQRVP